MEITKEQFEQAIAQLATKDDVQNAKEEILFRLSDAMASIEESLDPKERMTSFERLLRRIQNFLHIEV